MSLLHSLTSIVDRPSKRLGRGGGSGKGFHTAGRGQKGQKSRTGTTVPLWFEGGQLQLIKRLPMLRGKGRLEKLEPSAEVGLDDLEKMAADQITLETLKIEKVIDPRFKKAKVIVKGELHRKVTVQGLPVSKGARLAIEKAGGSVLA